MTIKILHQQGLSQLAIAKQLGISRNNRQEIPFKHKGQARLHETIQRADEAGSL